MKLRPVPVDAEHVRHCDGDFPSRRLRHFGRMDERRLRRRLVEQIAFQIEPGAARHRPRIHVRRREFGRGPQIRVHRALAVRRHRDHRARRRRPAFQRRTIEVRADLLHVGHIGRAQLVVGHLAEKRRPRAKAAQARHRVPGRSARRLHAARRQRVVEIVAPLRVDQVGARLGNVVPHQKVVIDLRDHVHDGVAERDDVVLHWHEIISTARAPRRYGKALPLVLKTGGLKASTPKPHGTS